MVTRQTVPREAWADVAYAPASSEGHRAMVTRETVPRETWADVADAPGYTVSSHGRVRSPSGRLIGKPNHARGYVRVSISGHRILMVHHLVAEAFLGPRRGAHVIHLDRDPSNNRADNLKYGTLPLGGDA